MQLDSSPELRQLAAACREPRCVLPFILTVSQGFTQGMKVILSRKGFDSSAGGRASPILENGQLLSFPIPEPAGSVAYSELSPRGIPVAALLRDLAPQVGSRCHLDPDLEASSIARSPGWRPAFGQSDAAARHLDFQGVGRGDLFLFFGWFRQVESVAGRWRYAPRSPDQHIIWGWLQIGAVLRTPEGLLAPGLERHPHCDGRRRADNRIYLADSLESGGVLPRLRPELVLTEPAQRRSRWRLPPAFTPRGRHSMSYHTKATRWTPDGMHWRLNTVGRGQEFVLDTRDYPQIHRWAEELIGSYW